MNRKSSVYLFCLVSVMQVFCCAVPCTASSSDSCSAAKEKYNEGVKLLNYEARLAAFQKAVDLCPSYAEAHVNLADACENLGLIKKKVFTEQSQIDSSKLLDKAERHYKRAIELNPSLIAPRLGLAIVSIAQGRFPKAIKNYEEVLRLEPRRPFIKERVEIVKKIDSSNNKKFRTSAEISSAIGEIKALGAELPTMGFEDNVVREIVNSPRQSFDNILFDGWSSAIKSGEPTHQLNEIGKTMTSQEYSLVKFVIEGHANTVGAFEENMTLSKNRAKAVKEYLVKQYNVNPNRILTQGFGFTNLKYEQGNDPRNRRVEVLFFNEDSKK